MLSRIANNLFWMARYLERAEHMSRYINVNYFSSLDAPVTVNKEFVLKSILRMNGSAIDSKDEGEILFHVAFNKENPASVINYVINSRENARSARDVISTELWESINRYYHFVVNYDVEAFKTTHLFDFAQQVTNMNMVIKGRMDSTLIHNNVWDIIKLGFHVERCIQILMAILTKLQDIQYLESDDSSTAVRSHQLATLLRGLESFDMSRKYYKKAPTLQNSVEFLLLNPDFPRSFLFCLQRIDRHLSNISSSKHHVQDSVEYFASKQACMLQFTTIEDLQNKLEDSLLNYINISYDLAARIEKQYLT